MTRILKYELRPGATTIKLPIGATPLHVHEQHGGLTLWVEVPEDPYNQNHQYDRTFHTYATGEEFETVAEFGNSRRRNRKYVGTAHIEWTVWHVYEERWES